MSGLFAQQNITSNVKQATEIIGTYGTCGGVVCPYCGGREYPWGTRGYAKCSYCGNVYEIPRGYDFRRDVGRDFWRELRVDERGINEI